jgi:tetratricopeptide (TPR) repeat protein
MLFAKKEVIAQNCYPRTSEQFLIKSSILNLRSNHSKSSLIKRVLSPKEHFVEVKDQDSVIDDYISVYVLYWDSFSTIKQERIIRIIDSGWVYLNSLELSGDDLRFIVKTGSLDDKAKAYALEIIREEDSMSLNQSCNYNPSRMAYAYRKLGEIYLSTGDYKTAIINFSKSIKVSTKNSLDEKVLSLYGRAEAKIYLSDFYGAREDLNQLLLYKYKIFYDRYLLAWEAKSNSIFPNYEVSLESTYVQLAVCCASIGEFALALDYISIVLNNNNQLGVAYLLKAKILLAQNQKESACKAASAAGELGYMEAFDFISQNCH